MNFLLYFNDAGLQRINLNMPDPTLGQDLTPDDLSENFPVLRIGNEADRIQCGIKILIFSDGIGIQQVLVDIGIGDVDMAPEAENLGADLLFKPGNQGCGDNHHRHTEGHRHHRNPDDEPGKRLLAGRGHASRYEGFEVHFHLPKGKNKKDKGTGEQEATFLRRNFI